MQTIWAVSKPYFVSGLKKKTADQFLATLKHREILTFHVPIKPVGRNRGIYATYVTIKKNNGENKEYSMNELKRVFDIVELVDMDQNE
jgi:hypothetical protein